MRFIWMLVLLLLTVPVYPIQRDTNLIGIQFSKIRIYCRQSFVKIRSSAQSPVECASYCLSLYTPYCKAFIWDKIYDTCSPIDELVSIAVADFVPVQSELDIYAVHKDGCTNEGYYYDLHSNTCLKLYVDSDGKTWKDARNHCQENGADLISLITLAKWNFVKKFTSCVFGVWIGLKDKRWVTNDIFQNIFNAEVQLNNYDASYTNERESGCGVFYSNPNNVQLHDESCNIRLKQNYICEILVKVNKRQKWSFVYSLILIYFTVENMYKEILGKVSIHCLYSIFDIMRMRKSSATEITISSSTATYY